MPETPPREEHMLERLFQIIEDRKHRQPAHSYTVQLMKAGPDAILQKIGEETTEVILAAKAQGSDRLVEEVADLFYHTLVLLSLSDLTLKEISAELENRHLQRGE